MLEIVEGPQSGRRIEVEGTVVVGRDEGSVDLVLDDPQVSRRHATLTRSGGEVAVEDLGSTNGTHVNDEPIQGRRTLRPGDTIRIGLTVIAVSAPEAATRAQSGVRPAPAVTRIGAEVLEPVAESELAGAVGAAGNSPALLVDESEPAFVAADVEAFATDVDLGADYADLARLVDNRVKRRTNIAAFAVVAIGALAVLIVLGSG